MSKYMICLLMVHGLSAMNPLFTDFRSELLAKRAKQFCEEYRLLDPALDHKQIDRFYTYLDRLTRVCGVALITRENFSCALIEVFSGDRLGVDTLGLYEGFVGWDKQNQLMILRDLIKCYAGKLSTYDQSGLLQVPIAEFGKQVDRYFDRPLAKKTFEVSNTFEFALTIMRLMDDVDTSQFQKK